VYYFFVAFVVFEEYLIISLDSAHLHLFSSPHVKRKKARLKKRRKRKKNRARHPRQIRVFGKEKVFVVIRQSERAFCNSAIQHKRQVHETGGYVQKFVCHLFFVHRLLERRGEMLYKCTVAEKKPPLITQGKGGGIR
jgi:hypothetical protein